MLRIGRGDTTPLSGFDENDYARAAQADRRQFGELLAEWSVVRAATIALATSLLEKDWINSRGPVRRSLGPRVQSAQRRGPPGAFCVAFEHNVVTFRLKAEATEDQ